jgi:hypothetical protein
MSGQVPPNEQGELQGALTSLISVTTIFGPLMMTNLFAHFTSKNTSVYFPVHHFNGSNADCIECDFCDALAG